MGCTRKVLVVQSPGGACAVSSSGMGTAASGERGAGDSAADDSAGGSRSTADRDSSRRSLSSTGERRGRSSAAMSDRGCRRGSDARLWARAAAAAASSAASSGSATPGPQLPVRTCARLRWLLTAGRSLSSGTKSSSKEAYKDKVSVRS